MLHLYAVVRVSDCIYPLAIGDLKIIILLLGVTVTSLIQGTEASALVQVLSSLILALNIMHKTFIFVAL